MNVDIIGDIHGQHAKLVELLSYMDYRENAGIWRHPTRQAIFVGNLIDRGPKQIATVELVRAMVEAGSARCIMGNHEFNAIAWATPDPDPRGGRSAAAFPGGMQIRRAPLPSNGLTSG